MTTWSLPPSTTRETNPSLSASSAENGRAVYVNSAARDALEATWGSRARVPMSGARPTSTSYNQFTMVVQCWTDKVDFESDTNYRLFHDDLKELRTFMENRASDAAYLISHVVMISTAKPYAIPWIAAMTGAGHRSGAEIAAWKESKCSRSAKAVLAGSLEEELVCMSRPSTVQ